MAAASTPHEGIVPRQDRIERARLLYERAVFGGAADRLDAWRDRLEESVRHRHGHFERALAGSEHLGLLAYRRLFKDIRAAPALAHDRQFSRRWWQLSQQGSTIWQAIEDRFLASPGEFAPTLL